MMTHSARTQSADRRTHSRTRPSRALLAASLALSATTASCDSEPPSTRVSRGHVRVEREVASPDGQLVARYSVIWGGGAAGYVQEVVEVRTRGDTAAPNEETAILDMDHGGDVTMRWLDSQHLEIVYPAWAGVLRGCRLARGVAVQFTARATPDSVWSDAARSLWHQEQKMEEDLARRGEPSLRGKTPSLVGPCP
jgi:hypothetical protein